MILEREFKDVFGAVCIPKHALEFASRSDLIGHVPDTISFSTPHIVNLLDFDDINSLGNETLRELIPVLVFGVINVLEDEANPITGSVFSLLDGYANPDIWDACFLGIWGFYTVEQYDLILKAVSHLHDSFMPWQIERIKECLFYLKVRAEPCSP